MTDPFPTRADRHLDEEFANALTHGVGILLSIIGLFVLVWISAGQRDWSLLTASAIYGLSLTLLYTASTLYHSFRMPRLKHIFRIVDHCAIYILIAGSYTPVTIVVLQGAWGWSLFAVVWLMALSGIFFKIFFVDRFNILSTILYLLMGWLAVVAVKPMIAVFPVPGLLLLVGGGLFYTLGVIFYAWHRLPFNHAVWHVFVLFGSICHFIAILLYIVL